MKMGAGLFWGILLIVIGLGVILRVLFEVNIFRIIAAVFFILIGIKMLIGKSLIPHEFRGNHVFFGERTERTNPVNHTEYSTVFAKTVYDFRDMKELNDKGMEISFKTAFGHTEVLIPEHIPVRIKTEAAFSSARMPDGNSTVFGTIKYNSESIDSTASVLQINANVVFGEMNIRH